jgi:hypothetical protein
MEMRVRAARLFTYAAAAEAQRAGSDMTASDQVQRVVLARDLLS